jgi:hypothetical protein
MRAVQRATRIIRHCGDEESALPLIFPPQQNIAPIIAVFSMTYMDNELL